MRLLLDTHVFLWWLEDSPHLGARARDILNDEHNELLWSLASSWELAIKVALGRMRIPEPLPEYLPRVLEEQSVRLLPIDHGHVLRVSELPRHHKDPFDRLLVAQAQIERVPVLTRDDDFRRYDVEVVW